MPYTITVTQPRRCICTDADNPNEHRKDCPQWGVPCGPLTTTRRAATLMVAQSVVDLLIEDHGGSVDEWPDVFGSLGSTDTIGPLPDGAVITVELAQETAA